jgi:hypothetical protein
MASLAAPWFTWVFLAAPPADHQALPLTMRLSHATRNAQ